MRTRGILCTLAATMVIGIIDLPAGVAQAASDDHLARAAANHQQAIKRIVDVQTAADRPDFVKLAEDLKSLGFDSVGISLPQAKESSLDASRAQELFDASHSERTNGPVVIMEVPLDAFDVWGVTGHFPGSPEFQQEYYYFSANWNFRDNYVNGSEPDDALGIAMSDYDNHCFQDPVWLVSVKKYDNTNSNNDWWVHSTSYNSRIINLRDRASGFVLTTDHGSLQVFMNFQGSGCDRGGLRGAGYFEHNQDGDGSWSAGIGLPTGMGAVL